MLLLFLLLIFASGDASSRATTCKTLAPNATIHGKPQSKEQLPFEIVAYPHYHESEFSEEYFAMLTYKVYIKAKNEDAYKSQRFKGFILQAQDINGRPIGNFMTDGRGKAKYLDCHDAVKATLINADWRSKASAGFYWFAPLDFLPDDEKVYFTGSIIKDEKTYWINVKGEAAASVKASIISTLFCVVFLIYYALE